MQMLIEAPLSYKLGTSPTKEPMHPSKKLQHLWMAAAAAMIALPVYAQNPPAFTAAQATEGQSAYAQNCAGCHGGSLDDGEFAPPLKGTAFTAQWGGKNVSELFEYIDTKMPPSNAGALGDTTYQQITAFVLQSNGLPLDSAKIPGGANGRPSAPAASGPGGGLSPYATLIPAPAKPDPLAKAHPRHRRAATKSSGQRVVNMASHL